MHALVHMRVRGQARGLRGSCAGSHRQIRGQDAGHSAQEHCVLLIDEGGQDCGHHPILPSNSFKPCLKGVLKRAQLRMESGRPRNHAQMDALIETGCITKGGLDL